MKSKIFLLATSFILISLISRAGNKCNGGPEPGKKEDIMGSVVNADNKKPLKDVMVTAVLASKKEKTVLSDCNGGYSFNDLKPGVYKFIFEKEGYKKVVKEKMIAKVDDGFQMDIEMIQEQSTDVMPSPSHFLYN